MGFRKACIMGLGYIGLPTAALLAKNGMDVLGVDIDRDIVNAVNSGIAPKIEPGLNEILEEIMDKGHLRASLNPETADAYVITVPTPFKACHQPDLSYIESAADAIHPFLQKGQLIILESTSPVGATEKLAEWLAAMRPDLSFPQDAGEDADIQLAYCPERVLPGKIVNEMVDNDRIIGGLTHKAAQMAAQFYKTFVRGELVLTNARTAEMCKLAENSFRDVNIAFANELSMLCEKTGIDVWELIKLANRHPRVKILNPGCGVGGHCIAVDPWFLVHASPELTPLIQAARQVNDKKPSFIINKIENKISELAAKNLGRQLVSIACLGLAFKPDIDDLRESPAIEIALQLAAKGYSVYAVEPNIKRLPDNISKTGIKLISLDEALRLADIFVLNVAHSAFMKRLPDLNKRILINSVGGN